MGIINMDLIIYLHGFRSTAEGNKSQLLRKMFPRVKVIALDYSPHDPELATQQLSKIITENDDDEIVVIGTSLGGFWARWAASRFFVKSILINPALHPDRSLKVGSYENYHDPSLKIIVTEKALAQFCDYKVSANSQTYARVLLAMDDDIIDAFATKAELDDLHNVICFDHGGMRAGHEFRSPYLNSNLISLFRKPTSNSAL